MFCADRKKYPYGTRFSCSFVFQSNKYSTPGTKNKDKKPAKSVMSEWKNRPKNAWSNRGFRTGVGTDQVHNANTSYQGKNRVHRGRKTRATDFVQFNDEPRRPGTWSGIHKQPDAVLDVGSERGRNVFSWQIKFGKFQPIHANQF